MNVNSLRFLALEKDIEHRCLCHNRSNTIRTCDLTHPKGARYQAAPYPVTFTAKNNAFTFVSIVGEFQIVKPFSGKTNKAATRI